MNLLPFVAIQQSGAAAERVEPDRAERLFIPQTEERGPAAPHRHRCRAHTHPPSTGGLSAVDLHSETKREEGPEAPRYIRGRSRSAGVTH